MTIRLYLDEDSMRKSLVLALRDRGVDAITALDAGMIHRSDEDHLIYASSQGRVLYSFNVRDYHQLHTAFVTQGRSHAGIILADQARYSSGEQMRRLLHLIAAMQAEDIQNQLIFLSAWS